jgi:menaquinone-dependent protoporphyrinogen oxidase
MSGVLRHGGLRRGPVQLVKDDAVVLGSAIYLGKWLKPATQFVTGQAAALASVPVRLFSSGPIGSPPPEDPADRRQGDELARAMGARDHRLFPGRLDRKGLSLVERAAVRAAKSPDGDFRPWDEIRTWAAGIAAAVRPAATG